MATLTVLLVLVAMNAGAILAVFFRRWIKNRFYLLRDHRRLVWAREIEEVLRGESSESFRPSPRYPWDWQGAEEALLEALSRATSGEREKLLRLFRRWGLFELRLHALLWGGPWQQGEAGILLARMRCPELLPVAARLAEHPRRDIRLAAINAVGLLGNAEGRPILLSFVARREQYAARIVRAALVRCARSEPGKLFAPLREGPPPVRRAAAQALADLAGKPHARGLLVAVPDPDPEVRAPLARALGRTEDPACFPLLVQLVQDPVWFVRLQAVAALGRTATPEARKPLWRATEDPDWRVRLKAVAALHRWSGDSVALFDQLHERGAGRESLGALVDVLERQGDTWRAIVRVSSLLPYAREESHAIVRHLLKAKAFSAIFYALEMFPDRGVRQALLALVRESGDLGVTRQLQRLVVSPLLEPAFRRQVQETLQQRGAAG